MENNFDSTRRLSTDVEGRQEKLSVGPVGVLGRIVSWNVVLMVLHQLRRPADTNKKAVRAAYPYLIEAPLSVPQDSSGPNDQVIHPGRNCIDVGRSDEDSEWIALLRDAPGALSSLREMHLATAARHDDVFVIAASPLESKALPKWHSGTQVVTWNNGEGTYGMGDGHGQAPIWTIPFIRS